MYCLRFPEGKDRALTLSYDDAVETDIRLVKIMSENGIKGTFNINSGLSKDNGFACKLERLSMEQIVHLYIESGNEVAIHGYKHIHLSKASREEIFEELYNDKLKIEKYFCSIIRGMAYAYGEFNQDVFDVMRRLGIVYSRTVVSTHKFDIPKNLFELPATCHHNDEQLNRLTESFINLNISPDEEAKLFYLWGHSYEFEKNNNWELIENFCKKIGNNSNIWYATNIEIFDYINNFKLLQISADEKNIYNPTNCDLWISLNNRIVKIPSGKKIYL